MKRTATILTGLLLAAALAAPAAPLFNIDFENPEYTVGDSYDAATDSGTLDRNGPAPDSITQMYRPGTEGWTATVETAGPTGNRLTFAHPGSEAVSGTLEAFSPPATGGDTGTWFAQMDYTRLTANGGPLVSMRLVNNVGQVMLAHPNNVLIYADNWEGNALTVGETYTLRVEIDMGTSNFRTYINGTLANSYTSATNVTYFGGLQLGLFGSTYDAGNVFALDNIQVGLVPYTLTYTAGVGGTISGSTVQTVTPGGDGTEVEAVPDVGYHFVDWSDASTDNPRQDLSVTGDIAVTANFSINIYDLTYTAGANGAITGDAAQTVAHGGDGTEVEAVPNVGYHFVDWSDASTDNPRQDLSVTGDIAVTATFAINEYTVVFQTDGTPGALVNGAVAVTYTVAHGADCTAVTAQPPTSQEFTGWSGDHIGMENPLTLTNITTDMTVTASFGKWLAQGRVVGLHADDVADLTTPGTFFLRPKFYALYHDPVKDPDQLLKAKKATLKVLTKIDKVIGQAILDCEWTRKIKLYSSKNFKAAQKAGTDAATWLAAEGNQSDLALDLHTSTKEADPVDQSVYGASLAAPEILTVTLGSAEGVSVVTIEGKWFGTKKPKVWREYTDAKTTVVIKQQKYKVLKAADSTMVDSKGKMVYMNPLTGESKVVVPVLTKDPAGTPTGDLVLDNGVGMATGPDPTVR